ncbi:MAG: aminoacyl-tRNA deacylase [Nitrospiria bacterium]
MKRYSEPETVGESLLWSDRKEGTPLILERLKTLFKKEDVPYRVLHHREAYTASEVARSIHTTGWRVVKVVIVRTYGQDIMAVLPACRQIDLNAFTKVLGKGQIALEKEDALRRRFPDCEAGAMPPFGGFYGLPVYCDASLSKEPVIYFQAGTHRDVIEMRYQDYIRIVQPKVCHFSMEPIRAASGF